MLDDMQGLFPSALAAYEAGQQSGRDTLFRHALQRLSELSVEHEKAGNVDAFRAAEMACGLLRSSNVIVQRNLAGERVN